VEFYHRDCFKCVTDEWDAKGVSDSEYSCGQEFVSNLAVLDCSHYFKCHIMIHSKQHCYRFDSI